MRPPAVASAELAYHRAHFLAALREDAVVCLECGRLCQAMGSHVRGHGLPVDEYRQRWGYNRRPGLISPALHTRRRAQALARNLAALAPPDARRQALA